MQIPINNNNSSNGKKLSAGEEELIEVPKYFDVKTYNQKNMQELKENYAGFMSYPRSARYTVAGIIILLAIIATFALSGESEADKAGRIATLDYKRQEQLKENNATRQATIDCDIAIANEMGKDKEIVPCTARTYSGSTIIPKVSAMEGIEVKETGDRGVGIKDTDVDCLKSFTNEQNQYNCFQSGASYVRSGKDSWGKPSQYFLDWKNNRTSSGTVTTASSVVPERVKHTGNTLTPAELFGPVKVADDCYISQTESVHVEVKNGGMFATDIGCKFGATGGVGGKAEVFAPDLRNKAVEYTVEYVGKDALLGSFIQLTYGKEAFYMGHTESKFNIGDKVKTGQRIGQMTMDGATTGWHVHFEYRVKNNSGTWASQRYFTAARETALDNKRKNTMKTDWKWGDTITATVYDLGDVKQNDASPWVGASGVNLQGHTNTIALTVDIRKSLGIKWGDKVMMCRKDSQEYCVYFEVHDEMNSRFRYACIEKNGYCIKMDIARQNSKHEGGAWTLMCKESECKVGQS